MTDPLRARVTTKALGLRGYCAASVHGTENLGLTDPEFIAYWFSLFRLDNQPKPHFVTKVDDDQQGLGVPNQIKVAYREGAETILQLRDDLPQTRGVTAATAMSASLLDSAAAIGARITQFMYGNEPDLNNTGATAETWAAAVRQVYENLRSRAEGFCIGSLSSWANAADFASAFADAFRGSTLPIRSFGVHQYQGWPASIFRAGMVPYLERIFGPHVEIANHETDLTFTPTSLGLHDYRGAAYTVQNNLEHAANGVRCCDFTLRNGVGAGALGNGLFKEDGDPHPSGEAMRDMVAPFMDHQMVRVQHQRRDASRVYANADGQIIIASYSEDPEQVIRKAYNQLRYGRTDLPSATEVWDYIRGAGPQPSDVDAHKLDTLRKYYLQAVADEADVPRTVKIEIPFSGSSLSLLGAQFTKSGEGIQGTISGNVITAQVWRQSAARFRVT